ncbi:uroporphyrinogen-III synthase [bacterium]|nr:uroporphyrinogen-III synthase [bacterium]
MIRVGVMQTLGKPAPSFLPYLDGVEWVSLAIQEVVPLCETLELDCYSEASSTFLFSSVAVFELYAQFDFKSFLKGKEIWVVGQKTLERVESFGLQTVCFGNTLKELLTEVDIQGDELKLVHPCSSKTRAVPSVFKELGIHLVNINVYEPRKLEPFHSSVKKNRIDILKLQFIVLYSSSQVDALFELWSEFIFECLKQGNLKFWCLGETAVDALKSKSISDDSYELIASRPNEWSLKLKARIAEFID